MEFQTQQNLVRVPIDRVENLVLTIKSILSYKQVSARTLFSLLGKLSATADFVLLGRLHLHPLQMCLLSVWRPNILPLDHPIDWISLTTVDEHKSLRNRNSCPPSRSQNIPLHGCQSFWMGSSFSANETILSWSLDGRPIPAPYQHVRNDGHTISTETSHNIYSPFLHHVIHRQQYGGLIYQQTGWHTFSQSVHGGMGDAQLVIGT